ncbi:MAG: hypothetical protein WBO45_25575, partial [Planctomycetota bacterium]
MGDPGANRPERTPPARRRRRLLFVLATLLVVVGAIELVGAIAWSLAHGTTFGWHAAAAARATVRGGLGVASD